MSTMLKIALGVVVLAGCNPIKQENLRGAKLKTVTIGAIDLKALMNGPATAEERDALMKSLTFQIKIKSTKCDNEQDSVDKTLESVKWDSTSIESVKVARNCSYIISMSYIGGDSKALLVSQTDTENLSKEELTKESPKVSIKLTPTDPDGVKYWLKEVSTTPNTGVGLEPTLGQTVAAECKKETGLDRFNEGKLAATTRDDGFWDTRKNSWGGSQPCDDYDAMVADVKKPEEVTLEEARQTQRNCHDFGWVEGNQEFLVLIKKICQK